jgi:NADH-quinone oxidoreductase subunit F
VDIRLLQAEPSAEEREAVEKLLGAPTSSWDGGERKDVRDRFTATGGKSQRDRRHLLLPALQALQLRVGWISEGGLNHVCERLNIPPAEAWSVATFYAQLATSPRPRRVVHVCDDVACRARGAKALCERLERELGPALPHAAPSDHDVIAERGPAWMHSPCLGLCDDAPAALVVEAGAKPLESLQGHVSAESIRLLVQGGVPAADASGAIALPQRGDASLSLLARVGVSDPTSLDAYRSTGGYAALARAFELGAEGVNLEVTRSGLVGRGGAAFPTGRKWDAVRQQKATPHYLVCNADESEPGTFKDRVLLCGDPFAIVESMTIAAFATGCTKGFLYVRAEYPLAHERMQHAIDMARAAGLLGAGIGGRDFSFDIEIRRGSGAYICGEETALFESIEGYRGEPRSKPPFPVEQGLFGKPTVVNNVETLANVLPIILKGSEAFAQVGTKHSAGTRLFCLSGNVQKPGVYEVPFGTTLRELLAQAGGLHPDRRLQAILMGGAAGTFLRADEIDLPLTMEDARAANTTLGSGVVVVFDDTADVMDAVLRIAAFFRDESCGQCVPCRVGTVRQEEALHRLASGCARGSVRDELVLISEVGQGMRDASICGLGQTAYAVVESAIQRLGLFGDKAAAAPAAAAPPLPAIVAQAAGSVTVSIDGRDVAVAPTATILDACKQVGVTIPTLCYLETLTPVNACRLCVVEVEGGRVLAPSCSRMVEPGMKVHTRSERVVRARRMVLEMLASSVDLSTAPGLAELLSEYECAPTRYGDAAPATDRDAAVAGHHAPPDPRFAATVAQGVKIDNDLYVRDYSKCVLCYKCVEACGEDHQNTFAIAVAGRGFDARISTELNAPLDDSACVYCGNCIAVCPTGALMAKTEFDLRATQQWDEKKQTQTDTICPYCGVGCTLRLHAQDGHLVKATSPLDHAITLGNLCIKGRFGWQFVQPKAPAAKDA